MPYLALPSLGAMIRLNDALQDSSRSLPLSFDKSNPDAVTRLEDYLGLQAWFSTIHSVHVILYPLVFL